MAVALILDTFFLLLSQNGRGQESHRPPGLVTSTEQGSRYSTTNIYNYMKLTDWDVYLTIYKDVCKRLQIFQYVKFFSEFQCGLIFSHLG